MEFFGAKAEWDPAGPAAAADSPELRLAEKMMLLASRIVELNLDRGIPPTQEQIDAIILDLL